MSDFTRLRVLSIPGEHVYPRTIRPENACYLPDPDINGNWWPHPALEAGWWTADRAADIDVVHIHFGFEHRTPAQIARLVEAIHAHDVGLVVTVHDIDNPHLSSAQQQDEHRQRLAILAQGADAVLTLTPSARVQLAGIVGGEVAVEVVAHPSVVTPKELQCIDATPAQPGVFVKSLRSNVVAAPEFYAALSREGTVVYVHNEPSTQQFRDELAARDVEVIVHEPMDNATLYDAVASCSAVVLPYLRGTHSGWLEMCRDLGVGVAVPDIGCYADQADTPAAVATYAAGDGAAAARAVRDLVASAPHPYQGNRQEQLDRIRQQHAEVYARVVRR